jgi:hypothetical protein
MLDVRYQPQTLSNLASLKIVFVSIPKNSTASRFGMVTNPKAAKESVPIYNFRFELRRGIR